MNWNKEIEVLTPLFNRGAYQDAPEIRVPSIRGMVRWWFRKLGGSSDEEKQAFGGMNRLGVQLQGKVMASSLVFRITQKTAQVAKPNPATLPHKTDYLSPQAAFAPGARFTLSVFDRFTALPPSIAAKVENTLEIWTLLGSLGLRSNRGGGSLWPVSGPETIQQFQERLALHKCNWPVYLADSEAGNTASQLQAAATDTVSEPVAIFGSARGGRLASPLKIKIVRLDNQLRLLITAPDETIIQKARTALQHKPIPARSKPDSWQKISP